MCYCLKAKRDVLEMIDIKEIKTKGRKTFSRRVDGLEKKIASSFSSRDGQKMHAAEFAIETRQSVETSITIEEENEALRNEIISELKLRNENCEFNLVGKTILVKMALGACEKT